jgi:lipopolysaccharide export LptBFGC system permease protein LptF
MIRLYLLVVAVGLFPIALSYGVNPAAVLPKYMKISVEGTDQTEIFRAVMCLYLGMVAFCLIAAFVRPSWQHVAVIWTVFFMFSLAIGRLISLVVDGVPSRILIVYLVVELAMGAIGLALLAREATEAG